MIYRTDRFVLDTADLSVRTLEGTPVKLYNRDFELLRYLCSRNGEAATSMEIIEAVWDRNAEYSSNVVAASVSNIRRHLGKDAVLTVRNRYLVRLSDSVPPAAKPRGLSREFFILSGSVLLSAVILAGASFYLDTKNASNSGRFAISSLDVDPPGNDNDNLDKESVTFKNVTDRATDITGWSVMDDMGHRYVFPKRVVNPGAEVRLVTGACRDDERTACWNFP